MACINSDSKDEAGVAKTAASQEKLVCIERNWIAVWKLHLSLEGVDVFVFLVAFDRSFFEGLQDLAVVTF